MFSGRRQPEARHRHADLPSQADRSCIGEKAAAGKAVSVVEPAGCCLELLSTPEQHQGLRLPMQHLQSNHVMRQMILGEATDV